MKTADLKLRNFILNFTLCYSSALLVNTFDKNIDYIFFSNLSLGFIVSSCYRDETIIAGNAS